jgi:hypothetical protein
MTKVLVGIVCLFMGCASLSAQVMLPVLADIHAASLSSSSAELPDAPSALQLSTNTAAAPPQQKSSPEEIVPFVVLPGRVTGQPLTGAERWRIYSRGTFGPRAFFTPAIGAAISLARPPKNYPDDWTSGFGGFGRQYGNRLAVLGAKHTAVYAVGSLAKEDPRYAPATSHNVLLRTGHAVLFTFVDKSDSGGNTLALANFAGALSGGFVGMAYLPPGYDDVTHAGQRSIRGLGDYAINNVIREFSPEIFSAFHKLHLPHGGLPVPVWWVKDKPAPVTHP